MEVHNISIDDNEADTSGDEMEDEDYVSIFKPFTNYSSKPSKNKDPDPTIFATFDTPMQSHFRSWERPKVSLDTFFYTSSTLQEQPDPFQFFLVDVVSTTTKVKHPVINNKDNKDHGVMMHNVIRLFGVTTQPKPKDHRASSIPNDDLEDSLFQDDLEGHDRTNSISVCCNVHGFLPYFYVLPVLTTFDDIVEEEYWGDEVEVENFKTFLNQAIKDKIINDIGAVAYHDFLLDNKGQAIEKIEVVKYSESEGIYHFFESRRNKGTVLLKVYCTLPRFIWTANSIIHGLIYKKMWKLECFETTINNNIRFLAEKKFTGCSWLELKGSSYFLRDDLDEPFKESYCQIELDVHVNDIIQLDQTHPRYGFDPALRVLSYDIEVMLPSDQSNPKDGKQQVLQIGVVVGNYYLGGAGPDPSIIGKTVFVLGTCMDIEDTKVFQFYIKEDPQRTEERYMEDAEAKMLAAFRDFVIQMDPDIITGYNIRKFDIPYLMDRANSLTQGGQRVASVLPFLGRLKNVKSSLRSIQNDLKKLHKHDDVSINIQGRIICDLYPLTVRHDRLNQGKGYYKLGSVAKRYLNKGEEKQDVKYTEIEGLHHGTPLDRQRMARYCLQDAVIPLLLLFGPVPNRGDQVRYLDLYYRKCRRVAILRYLMNKSTPYNEYVKQVRVQKNPGLVPYLPETPSPQKLYRPSSRDKTDENNGLFGEVETSSVQNTSYYFSPHKLSSYPQAPTSPPKVLLNKNPSNG